MYILCAISHYAKIRNFSNNTLKKIKKFSQRIPIIQYSLYCMGQKGFEPLVLYFRTICSNPLSYKPHIFNKKKIKNIIVKKSFKKIMIKQYIMIRISTQPIMILLMKIQHIVELKIHQILKNLNYFQQMIYTKKRKCRNQKPNIWQKHQ